MAKHSTMQAIHIHGRGNVWCVEEALVDRHLLHDALPGRHRRPTYHLPESREDETQLGGNPVQRAIPSAAAAAAYQEQYIHRERLAGVVLDRLDLRHVRHGHRISVRDVVHGQQPLLAVHDRLHALVRDIAGARGARDREVRLGEARARGVAQLGAGLGVCEAGRVEHARVRGGAGRGTAGARERVLRERRARLRVRRRERERRRQKQPRERCRLRHGRRR